MTNEQLAQLEDLLNVAINSQKEAFCLASKCQRQCIVNPGFPILWFGDIDTYLKTPKDKRAITVGVNPSGSELYYDRTGHFTHFTPLTTDHAYSSINDYVLALNNYFNNNPLGWFKKGMDDIPFSYNNGNLIHVDCCSTIATRPTWTGLCDSVKSLLRTQNESIFERLLKLLQPSKVFIASNRSELPYIESFCMKVLNLAPSQISRIKKY